MHLTRSYQPHFHGFLPFVSHIFNTPANRHCCDDLNFRDINPTACRRAEPPQIARCRRKSSKTSTGPAGSRPTSRRSARRACPTTRTSRCSRRTTAPSASSARGRSPSSRGPPTAPMAARSAPTSASPAPASRTVARPACST